MDDKTALSILEGYFSGEIPESRYEEALDYIINSPCSNLTGLFRELVTPGGIACEKCQAWMPQYLDVLERQVMAEEEKTTFLLHLVRCQDCAEEFRELKSFISGDFAQDETLEIPRFKIPGS